MASSDKEYRSVVGFVQFPPREGEAGGKAVRNITIRQTGFGKFAPRVSATLWPSHAHVEVNEGDLVALEGSYTTNTQTKDDGSKVTYHNVSVTRIKVLGSGDEGKRPDTENTEYQDDDGDDDDLPF